MNVKIGLGIYLWSLLDPGRLTLIYLGEFKRHSLVVYTNGRARKSSTSFSLIADKFYENLSFNYAEKAAPYSVSDINWSLIHVL